MTTKMTANGVSTTTTPGTEQYEVFYTGYPHGERNSINTITATLMESCFMNSILLWKVIPTIY